MVDTKNVLVRAALCASCHVGSAENDVTHDMLAAGHPPLRFEMASHQALIERKHWDDAAATAQPEYEVQLWAAGRIASAEAALDLLEGRAKRAATDETRMNTNTEQGRLAGIGGVQLFCVSSVAAAGSWQVEFGLGGGTNKRSAAVAAVECGMRRTVARRNSMKALAQARR